ncbi:M20 aminoacylase family protein [Neobacillus rhizophilus]|uniref:Amidohydrolase n=1 Tax=Neobacillus rhizophilus TaxID=2833579 RepID=A0A942U3V4_9BACI|nr:M20 aminoacylase family protein [Neobacillus rhizophilus]MBS4212362.1 amidohydrolase [Neobacillus rhizophilus]MBU8915795.1 amidohydrolase [Bacillus sp. FJAT-29953]
MNLNSDNFERQLTEWRHYLHAHPESAFEEKHTSEFLAVVLTDMGLEVHRNIGGTGIVANLTVGDGKGIIGIRSDIDAINLTEVGKHPYTSQNPGKMHACGHDGHMATVLGAAKLLTERKNFNGTVRFIFQPAEETGKGAFAMMQDGLFERFPVDEIYGMHNMPGMPAGSISTRAGGIMASEDNFVIRIKGQGSHASSPHMGKDPIVIASEIVLALQTIISRNMNPNVPAVISCTEFITDGIRNAIPTNVEIKGDTRSYTTEVQKLLEERMRTISEGICQINGAECQFEYTHEFAPTVNWADCVEIAVKAAQNVVGDNNVDGNCQPWMASEDFGAFLQKTPGCFVFIGNGDDSEGIGNVPLHNSSYDFNDKILTIGAEYFAELIKVRLPK